MPVANTSFKVGDRVRYFGEGDDDEGMVVPDDVYKDREWKLVYPDSIWVKWESDGEILQVRASDLGPSDSQSKLTVQTCIDFLISQGYTVSLSKN